MPPQGNYGSFLRIVSPPLTLLSKLQTRIHVQLSPLLAPACSAVTSTSAFPPKAKYCFPVGSQAKTRIRPMKIPSTSSRAVIVSARSQGTFPSLFFTSQMRREPRWCCVWLPLTTPNPVALGSLTLSLFALAGDWCSQVNRDQMLEEFWISDRSRCHMML